jgi:hypothetical protein
MKKIVFLLALLPSVLTNAQTSVYHPFPDSNALWNFHVFISGYPPVNDYYSILIQGDTLINGIVYQKLTTPFIQSFMKSGTSNIIAGYKGAIRQDTSNRKVFFIPPASVTEQLLYDFTMHAGDTVRGYIESNLNPKDIVESVDSVLVGSNYRKRWKINSGYSIYFIEGIGSTYGMVEYSPGTVVDAPDISISCFSQNGVPLYPDTVTGCDVITSVDLIGIDNDRVNIYPNPSSGSFTVETGDPLYPRELWLMDLSGKIILKRPLTGKSTAIITGLQPGSYILKISGGTNRTEIKKLILCPE